MAATLIQSNSNSGVTTALTIAFNNPVTPGSLLVCTAGVPAVRTISVSDSVNGSYNNDVNTAAAVSLAITSFPNTASGTPTVTVSITSTATSVYGIIQEWSGVQTVSPLDKTQSNNGTGTTTGDTGTTASLTQQNELVIAMMQLSGTAGTLPYQVASPFTVNPSSPVPNSTAAEHAGGYNLPGASQSGQIATFNWTTSRNWRGAIATYKTVQLGQLAPLYNRKNVLYFT